VRNHIDFRHRQRFQKSPDRFQVPLSRNSGIRRSSQRNRPPGQNTRRTQVDSGGNFADCQRSARNPCKAGMKWNPAVAIHLTIQRVARKNSRQLLVTGLQLRPRHVALLDRIVLSYVAHDFSGVWINSSHDLSFSEYHRVNGGLQRQWPCGEGLASSFLALGTSGDGAAHQQRKRLQIPDPTGDQSA